MPKNLKDRLVDEVVYYDKPHGFLQRHEAIFKLAGLPDSAYDIASWLSLALRSGVKPKTDEEFADFIRTHQFKTMEEWLKSGRRVTVSQNHAHKLFDIGDKNQTSMNLIDVYEKHQTKPLDTQELKQIRRKGNSKEITPIQKTAIETSMSFKDDKELFIESLNTPEGKQTAKKYFEKKIFFQIFSIEHKISGKIINAFLIEKGYTKLRGKNLKKGTPTAKPKKVEKEKIATEAVIVREFQILEKEDNWTSIKIIDFKGESKNFIFSNDILQKFGK
jgi:hypothetical protein